MLLRPCPLLRLQIDFVAKKVFCTQNLQLVKVAVIAFYRMSRHFIWLKKKLAPFNNKEIGLFTQLQNSKHGLLRFFPKKTSPISLIASKMQPITAFYDSLEFSCQNISFGSMCKFSFTHWFKIIELIWFHIWHKIW